MQSDPIGLAAGVNTFGYAGANSLFYYDSRGLDLRAAGAGLAMAGGAFMLACPVGSQCYRDAVNAAAMCWDAMTGSNDSGSDNTAEGIEEGAAKPPTGSKPIDETPWSGDHKPIKDGVGAGPDDSTKIDPDDNVWVENPDGSWTNHGNAGDYTGSGSASGQKGRDRDRRRRRRR